MKEAAVITPLDSSSVHKFEILTEMKFGRLTPISVAGKDKSGRIYWLCSCDCSKEKIVRAAHLKSGKISSCGCWHDEFTVLRSTKHGFAKRKGRPPEYGVWKGIRRRCNDVKCPAYKNYGGRNIKMDPEWEDFEVFYRDMGSRPSPNHTIERIDNDGDYCKSNCKWATMVEQANNRRSIPVFEHNGETMTMAMWSRRVNLPAHVLTGRQRLGWPMDKLLTTPVKVYAAR